MVFTVRAFIAQQESFDDTLGTEEPGAFGTLKNLPVPKEALRLTVWTGVKNILNHCSLLLSTTICLIILSYHGFVLLSLPHLRYSFSLFCPQIQ
jgi:hypothetical protein